MPPPWACTTLPEVSVNWVPLVTVTGAADALRGVVRRALASRATASSSRGMAPPSCKGGMWKLALAPPRSGPAAGCSAQVAGQRQVQLTDALHDEAGHLRAAVCGEVGVVARFPGQVEGLGRRRPQ